MNGWIPAASSGEPSSIFSIQDFWLASSLTNPFKSSDGSFASKSKDIYAARILALKSGFFYVLVLNISTLVNENLLYYLTHSGKVIHINDRTVRKYLKKNAQEGNEKH